tara:strand:+ start:623 stop:1021 length:399 start_codon:yes stop_codon:yes gene_type:complete
MPGLDDDSYMAGETATQAAEAIDAAIDEGKRGTDILSTLLGSGMRVYTAEEMDGAEEAPMDDPMADPMEEPPMDDAMAEEPPMDEGPESGGMPFEGPQEPQSGKEGGMRDMRIAAVRFALDKDKENKSKAEA